MSRIGILGGMGSAATVDFMAKLLELTPATCDQEHIPMVVVTVPHAPDRSAAILGAGASPLPDLERAVRQLNQIGVGLIAIPCNSAHYWYAELMTISAAPMLHIAHESVSRLPDTGPVLILATPGVVHSGIYQCALQARNLPFELPSAAEQALVNGCIQAVKAGNMPVARQQLSQVLQQAVQCGINAAILGCTELPLAAARIEPLDLVLLDSTLELARSVVNYALERGWNQAAASIFDHLERQQS